MDALTKSRVQMAGAWGAIGYLVLLFLGWGAVAGFLPPTPPSAGAEHVAALIQSDHTRIRIGMVLVMLAALVFIPYAAAAAHYVARIEGGAGILTYTLLLGAAGNMALTFYPAIWWLTAAYRPDRGAEQIYLVNDMAWLQFIGGATIFLAMPLALAIASLCDKSNEPTFPRWFGYANIWIILAVIPDQLLFFFHGGPFAWNGVFGLWIPVVAFGGFFIVCFLMLRRAILRDRAEIVADGRHAAAVG
ncbi:hypothetical protein FHT40_000221 [Mycolicibacterium sp. BK556]|uniref:hypothetical protein n=1 Tax=Mycobacteriaceae TaxID=1762 RepID=UPI001060DDEC|nr:MULTISPECIES: hypothetical protein [Mycobacteriaceae]MBB3600588.1 hypothetical protein [Mycolicibacterium sp. BK556]MBB3630341.1 hypothetical protein [Mycolicibacterium sp. BK607]MBB3748340.1 hypothetical protein [Mycolicibacterium sp. BK634]TDO10130.1 hypothetical protein EV580_4415 [Mycobacterium sp. BK086]